MNELEKDFNLEDLEAMSKEGLDHFDNDEDLKNIESDAISQIESRLEEPMSSKSSIGKLLLVLVLILALSYLVFSLLVGGDSTHDLYASNYNSPPFLLNTTERSSDSQSDQIAEIKNLYAQKQYKECLAAISDNNDASLKSYPDLAFYKGICLLELDQGLEASKAFANPSIKIEDVRLWYLSLAHLKAGNTNDCISNLDKLLALEGTYMKDRAKALIEELNKK